MLGRYLLGMALSKSTDREHTMWRSRFSACKVVWVCCLMGTLICSFALARGQTTSSYQQTNLVSDGSVTAQHTDPTLINPWGIAIGQATPFWVNSQGGGVSEVYDAAGNRAFDVAIPGKNGSTTPGHPTGIVFNTSNSDFMLTDGVPATFILPPLTAPLRPGMQT